MKTLDILRNLYHIAFVDDERDIGNGIIVVLEEGWYFINEPDCGVRGFDKINEAVKDCSSDKVFYKG